MTDIDLKCPPVPFSVHIPEDEHLSLLSKFKKTPDHWIERDDRMVLLTGMHPYNVEPPLKLLHSLGPVTPAGLHYVRNHGAPPQLKWQEHTLTVKMGQDDSDSETVTVFSMDKLTELKAFTQPVTLVCAGNRRKEENEVMRTIGFNWGAAGCGTSLWTGPLLSDVLRAAGIKEEETWDSHCELIGFEDLPNKVGPGPHNWPEKVSTRPFSDNTPSLPASRFPHLTLAITGQVRHVNSHGPRLERRVLRAAILRPEHVPSDA